MCEDESKSDDASDSVEYSQNDEKCLHNFLGRKYADKHDSDGSPCNYSRCHLHRLRDPLKLESFVSVLEGQRVLMTPKSEVDSAAQDRGGREFKELTFQ